MFRHNHIYTVLLPLSWLYGGIIWLRNKFFDWKIFPGEFFNVPVISIGNLAVGGTGKTPHTEYLIRLLSKQYKVAVLSRGYQRKTKQYLLAGAGASAQTIGDEPFQMHRKFPDILVAVDKNRREGIQKLLNLPENQRPEVILLDDAYQHRYVKPSLSILLTDSKRLFTGDALLPAGRLREPASNRARADIVICTKCPESLKEQDYERITDELQLSPHQELYFTSYQYKGLLPVFPESHNIKKESLERLKKEDYSIVLVAGLANPSDLKAYLQAYTRDLQTILYSDHHFFTASDCLAIAEKLANISHSRKMIITSEKDAVRLMGISLPEEIKKHLFYLPVEPAFHLNQEYLFILKIENHVKEFTRNRILA